MENNKIQIDLKEKKTALITGSSSGIGYEFSKLFAQDGYNLVLVARNIDIRISTGENRNA